MYEQFATKILKNKRIEDVCIISFNFDYLLQEDFKENVYFDYLISFDTIDPNRKLQYKKENPLPLLKLNGSLDWSFCPNCGKLTLLFPHLFPNFYYQAKCNNGCGGSLRPFIVIPHEKYNEKIEVLWRTAREFLSEAEKITIIGYSFPAYDDKVKKLFCCYLNKNAEVYVVDKKEKQSTAIDGTKLQINNIFTHNKLIKFSFDGFANYVEHSGNVKFVA